MGKQKTTVTNVTYNYKLYRMKRLRQINKFKYFNRVVTTTLKEQSQF